ncbi:MAG TPA: hypothetical protein VMH28_32360 [Candidatus Acidoferrales bacterium]|nr:hypothetical protein [Candidatus Acidoferrales bacterium]
MIKLGAENKKAVWALSILGAVAAIVLYTNVISDSTAPAPSPAKSAVAGRSRAVEMPTAESAPATPARKLTQRARSDEFRPVFRSKRPEDRIDPLSIDPTLRTDLLAKVQKVALEGGARNLFQFGAAPPPPKEELKGPEPKIVVAKKYDYPRPVAPPAPPGPPPPPPPDPPIDVKYYGLATTQIDGKKTAFFLDGDSIILAPEGGIVKKKYRVVRIGLTSVQMENVDSKKQQTVQLAEDAGASMSD